MLPVSPWAVRYCIIISMLLSPPESLSPGSGPEIHVGITVIGRDVSNVAVCPFFCKGNDLLEILSGRVNNKRHADAPLRYGAYSYELTVRRFIGCHNPRPAIVRDRWRSLGVQRKQEQRRCEDETHPVNRSDSDVALHGIICCAVVREN
jgi:hypothetical protein